MTTDKTIDKLGKVFKRINTLMIEINQDGIDRAVDIADNAFFNEFKKNPTKQRLINLLDKCDNIRIACACEISFPKKGEKTKIRSLQTYLDNFFQSFDVDKVVFKREQRKICSGGERFFRVDLTKDDLNVLQTNPEVIAESLENEFHPSTFTQYINNGLGVRYALMKKKAGD